MCNRHTDPLLCWSWRVPQTLVAAARAASKLKQLHALLAMAICARNRVLSQQLIGLGVVEVLAAIIASKPPAATAGSVKAIWESLDMPRSVALRTALKYCQIGNPIGTAQVDRAAIMGKAKSFTTR